MDTIKINKRSSKMVAHAGLMGMESPNTIAGYIAAGNRSYWAIETDILLTKDKKFIVNHDDSTLAVTGIDKRTAECTLEELQQLPVYDRRYFGGMEQYGLIRQEGKFRSDLRLPSLTEYVSLCKKYDKVAVAEIKCPLSDEEIQILLDEFRQQDYLDKAIFLSYHWDTLAGIRKVLPEQTIQVLIHENFDFTDEFLDRTAEQKFDLDINYLAITRELVERIHSRGIKINCWTVDWPDRAEELAEWGVEYITSDILE